MEDWGAVRGRLEYEADHAVSKQHRADIRAALERIEERETTECREILRLRQRVEELERERDNFALGRLGAQQRAEAAEKRVAKVVEVVEGMRATHDTVDELDLIDDILAAVKGE